MAAPPSGYLGSSYPVPTDPSYYLSQTGLGSLVPQAFNADTLAGMFAPQGMANTPVNSMATNPFVAEYLKSTEDATRLQRRRVPGLEGLGGNAGGMQ